MCCGSLEYYDKAYDRVNVKSEKPLQRIDRIFHTVTTTDDPIIRKLSKTEGNVYATDAILAAIMCCTRSNYSWDIVIEKIGMLYFLIKVLRFVIVIFYVLKCNLILNLIFI